MNFLSHFKTTILFIMTMSLLTACDTKVLENNVQPIKLAEPIQIQHAMGNLTLDYRPQKVAALSMNEVDILDHLGIPIAGMPKDFIPHFLKQYQNREEIADLGSIVQTNVEKVYRLKPDLILASSLQAMQYSELEQIAPSLYFNIDFKNSEQNYIETVINFIQLLGLIFDKQTQANALILQLNNKLDQIKAITANRPEKALIILHNNGSFTSFGLQSRYSFIFSEFGVQPASHFVDNSLHGQPISSEFISQANPDIIFVIDRTAVMEHRSVISVEQITNPLIRETQAWKNNKIIMVDPDAWYTTSASPTALEIIMNDLKKAYQ